MSKILSLNKSLSDIEEQIGAELTGLSRSAREALDIEQDWDFDSVDAAVRICTSRLKGEDIDAVVLPHDKPVFVQSALEMALASEEVEIYPLHRNNGEIYPQRFLESMDHLSPESKCN